MRSRATTPLSKAKVRQSWSKYNLYNLSRVQVPTYRQKTFYQQKWLAKSALRSYHGEPVREAHWTKLFRRRIRAVVPMSPDYLAQNDGSRESAGRGSGLKLDREWNAQRTPYMNMAFAPLERRLDTAIFRSLFASSTRQARQFVVHGAVKVNGRKMKYPGYLLNPGDMFQVDPERVMFATGAPKPGKVTKPVADAEDGTENPEQVEAKDEAEEDEEEQSDDTPDDRTPRQVLKDLQAQARFILSSERASIGAKKKQALRGFTKSVKRVLSRSQNQGAATGSLEDQLRELKLQLKVSKQKRQAAAAAAAGESQDGDSKEEKEDATAAEVEDEDEESSSLSQQEENILLRALTEMNTNPIDPSRPYATPWRPRDYMSAFAFIPRYLEVNQNICAAVFLRHPVARPSIAEVPTPFGLETNGAAFAWYLRRR